MLKISFLVCVLLSEIHGQVFFLNKTCPQLPAAKNLDMMESFGNWFIVKIYHTDFLVNSKCVTGQWQITPEKKLIAWADKRDEKTNKRQQFIGYVTQDSDDGEAKYKMSLNGTSMINSNYWILDMDSKSWSVGWMCEDVKGGSEAKVWFLTRKQHPSEEVLQKCYDVLKKNHLDTSLLLNVDQSC